MEENYTRCRRFPKNWKSVLPPATCPFLTADNACLAYGKTEKRGKNNTLPTRTCIMLHTIGRKS